MPPRNPGLWEMQQSSTTAWGLVNRDTDEVTAYRDTTTIQALSDASYESDGLVLSPVFYHPDHGWVTWADHIRVRDGKHLRRL